MGGMGGGGRGWKGVGGVGGRGTGMAGSTKGVKRGKHLPQKVLDSVDFLKMRYYKSVPVNAKTKQNYKPKYTFPMEKSLTLL